MMSVPPLIPATTTTTHAWPDQHTQHIGSCLELSGCKCVSVLLIPAILSRLTDIALVRSGPSVVTRASHPVAGAADAPDTPTSTRETGRHHTPHSLPKIHRALPITAKTWQKISDSYTGRRSLHAPTGMKNTTRVKLKVAMVRPNNLVVPPSSST